MRSSRRSGAAVEPAEVREKQTPLYVRVAVVAASALLAATVLLLLVLLTYDRMVTSPERARAAALERQQIEQVLKRVEDTAERVESCTTPGEDCQVRGEARTAAAIGDINRVSVLAAYCARVPENRTLALVTACVRDGLEAAP